MELSKIEMLTRITNFSAVIVSARSVDMRGTHLHQGLQGGLRVVAGVAEEAGHVGSGVAIVHPTPVLTTPR